ncbi:MAG: CDP-glycerol:glycerophosphate glycerophosphotransferase [Defluviitaleaceae bacterium]|nr:CDP-glycerol:glycerophosphate glycerophosphotransferase [Defluviitaleaceae bacterium]
MNLFIRSTIDLSLLTPTLESITSTIYNTVIEDEPTRDDEIIDNKAIDDVFTPEPSFSFMLPVTVLLDVYPYELVPDSFAQYLSLRERGVTFTHVPTFSFTQMQEPCIVIEAGQRLNDDVIRYIGYFFEDSDCPLVFIPVLGEGESLPEAIQNLPPGGIVHDFAPLLSYNFICAAKDPSLLDAGALQAAVRLGSYGILNRVTAEGATIHRTLTARDLYDLPDTNLIEEFILNQATQPIETGDEDIGLLLPHISPALFGLNPPEVRILSVTNHYEMAEITGEYITDAPDREIKPSASTQIIFHETTPLNQTVRDKLIPRFSFRCRLALEEAETSVTFKLGRKTIRTEMIALPEDTRNYAFTFKKNALQINKIAMRPHYKVSCIIPVYNAAPYINEAVESIIAQSLDFFPYIQIVLINDGSTDDSPTLCEALAQKYPYNIVYALQANKGASAARNAGRRYAMGEYILFLDADDLLDVNLIQAAVNALDNKPNANYDFVAFPIKMFGTDNLSPPELTHRFTDNGAINIKTEPDKVQFSASGVLMRAEAIKGIFFDEELTAAEDAEFIARAFADKQQYLACKDAFYHYRVTPGKYGRNLGQYGGTALFADRLAAFSMEKYGAVTPYIQHVILRDITRAFIPETDTDETEAALIETAVRQLTDALRHVDDTAINNARKLTPHQREYLLRLKQGEEAEAPAINKIHMDYMLEQNGNVIIRGYIYLPDYDGINLTARCEATDTEYTARLTADTRVSVDVFGLNQCMARAFTFTIPTPSEEILLSFTADVSFPPGFVLIGKESVAHASDNDIRIAPLSRESIAKTLQNTPSAKKEITDEYINLYPLLNATRLWLFVSPNPLEKNATAHFYDYCASLTDGIDCRLVVSADEVPLHPEGTAIALGSKTHATMSLFAEKIIISDAAEIKRLRDMTGLTVGTFLYLPNQALTEADRPALAALNGLPITAVALLSPHETDFLPAGLLRDAAFVTGNPIFDALTDRANPRILFMPNYRKHLYLGENKFNPDFRDSEYATRIGDILLEERFLDVADALGISVDFAPHAKTFLHLSDLERDDSVKVIPPAYPRLPLCQDAALLITDTLPAHGFAYLNKPVIYFNFDPDNTPPRDNAAFGESTSDFEELIDLLVYYMQNNFTIKPEYKTVADGFFPYRDGESCRRVYEATQC